MKNVVNDIKAILDLEAEQISVEFIGDNLTDKNRLTVGEKLRGAEKVRRIPIKVIPTEILPPKAQVVKGKSAIKSKN